MTPELVVQNKITEYLTFLENMGHPLIHDRRQAGGFNYKMGIPDLWAVYNGIHIEIEVKAPGGELRSMQEKYRDKCKRRNILWTCCDNLIDFIQFMEENFHVSKRRITQSTQDNEGELLSRTKETEAARRSRNCMEQIKGDMQKLQIEEHQLKNQHF